MGDEAVKKVMRDQKVYPMEMKNARELLSRLPRKVVERVAENMANVAVSRADAIRCVLQDLPRGEECCDDHDGA
jgi:hypothetical protein